MGLAEAFCLVPATSFGCSGVECGRVLREDRGAPSGWFAGQLQNNMTNVLQHK